MRVHFIRTHACQGGDGNHADVPDEQHDGRKYVDMDVSECILDTQVHEAVRHGCLCRGVCSSASYRVVFQMGTLLPTVCFACAVHTCYIPGNYERCQMLVILSLVPVQYFLLKAGTCSQFSDFPIHFDPHAMASFSNYQSCRLNRSRSFAIRTKVTLRTFSRAGVPGTVWRAC